MFFATKLWVANAFNETIQVWQTEIDIQVLFLIEYFNHKSWAISSLPQIFNSLFPSNKSLNFDDLDIKYRDVNRRDKLIRKRFDDYKVSGWLSSLENKVELEVCLFDRDANSKQLLLLDTVRRTNKNYCKDSLKKIEVFPSGNFYHKTNQQLNGTAPSASDKKYPYKGYKEMVSTWIKNEVRDCMEEIAVEHYYYDLRTKLKI